MNDIKDAFNCCIQCQDFWDCKIRLENIEKERETPCCSSCTGFELCKIVKGNLKEIPPEKQSKHLLQKNT